jgi:hypothetical protein
LMHAQRAVVDGIEQHFFIRQHAISMRVFKANWLKRLITIASLPSRRLAADELA